MFLKLSIILVLGFVTIGTSLTRQQGKQMCKSVTTFCAQCQTQAGGCKRVNAGCDTVLKEESGDPMQQTLCRQVRSQCNLCMNQGRNCRNLQRQCNPVNATTATAKPDSPEMDIDSTDDQNQGEVSIGNQSKAAPGVANTTSSSSPNKGKNNKNNCRKFGARCSGENKCCNGLRCPPPNSKTKTRNCEMRNSKNHAETIMKDALKNAHNEEIPEKVEGESDLDIQW